MADTCSKLVFKVEPERKLGGAKAEAGHGAETSINGVEKVICLIGGGK